MKKSEDNLENFFRNRAEGNQYEFEEGDWAKMESKLDADMPVVSPIPYSKYGWMGLGAIITAIIFVGYIQYSEWTSSNKNDIVINKAETLIDKESVSSETEMVEINEINPNQVESLENSTSDSKSLISNQKTSNLEVVGNQQNITTDNNQKPSSNEVITKINEDSADINFSRSIAPNTSGVIAIADVEDERVIVQKNMDADTQQVGYEFTDFNLAYSSIVSKKQSTPLELKYQRLYTLSLLAGVDVTSTDASEWGSPVVRFGIAGEYYVGKRWSIGLGANLSKKKYQAKGTEYSPPKGFWTNGVVPDSTNAVCQVLDVPISVNYFQPINDKSNLIISGGLSSWFMLKEDYWYKYKSNDPDLVSWWGGENEHKYWFSVINISLAYEYSLTNRWSVAVGPYINIPLSGVGHGNVELQSFGVHGALRFNKYRISKF